MTISTAVTGIALALNPRRRTDHLLSQLRSGKRWPLDAIDLGFVDECGITETDHEITWRCWERWPVHADDKPATLGIHLVGIDTDEERFFLRTGGRLTTDCVFVLDPDDSSGWWSISCRYVKR